MSDARTCAKIKADGSECEAYAMNDSAYCYAHDPDTKRQWELDRKRGAKSGGRARTAKSIARSMGLGDLEHVDLSTPEGYVAFLEDLVRAACDELDMTSSNLNAIVKAVQAVGEARFIPEIQDKLDRIEKMAGK